MELATLSTHGDRISASTNEEVHFEEFSTPLRIHRSKVLVARSRKIAYVTLGGTGSEPTALPQAW